MRALMSAGELLALRWSDVNLAQSRLTVQHARPKLAPAARSTSGASCTTCSPPTRPRPHTPSPPTTCSATTTGNADTRSNIAKRLKRAVERANEQLALREDIAPIATDLTPHSLRRTFATLLYLRGENPVYVMHQMGHTDPKLALRIYTKVMGEQRRRGPGARLVGVLDGEQWIGERPPSGGSAEQAEAVTIAVG